MSDSTEEKVKTNYEARRRRPSLFGPILLISVGVYFLLLNLGVIENAGLNWYGLLQLWPLWLIFVGVNILVQQIPGGVGTLLSGLVGVTAVAVAAYVLLFSEDNALLNRFGVNVSSAEVKTETIAYDPGEVDTAVVEIDFNAAGADVTALADSRNLVEGTVTYVDDIMVNSNEENGQANFYLDTRSTGVWFFGIGDLVSVGNENRWQLGLNPNTPTRLRLDVGSGSVDLDLSELDLQQLWLEGGSGSMQVALPDGVYDAEVDAASGATRMTLPGNGRQTIEIEGSSGSILLYLPESMEARLEVGDGSGSFNVDTDRLTQITGNEPDEGIWETDGYEDAANYINLTLDISSGSVTIADQN